MSLLNPTVLSNGIPPEIFSHLSTIRFVTRTLIVAVTNGLKIYKRGMEFESFVRVLFFVLLTDLNFTINVIKYQIKINKIIYILSSVTYV